MIEQKRIQRFSIWTKERGGTIETEYKQVLDELANEIDFIIIIFKTPSFENWNGKCSHCISCR